MQTQLVVYKALFDKVQSILFAVVMLKAKNYSGLIPQESVDWRSVQTSIPDVTKGT